MSVNLGQVFGRVEIDADAVRADVDEMKAFVQDLFANYPEGHGNQRLSEALVATCTSHMMRRLKARLKIRIVPKAAVKEKEWTSKQAR